MNWEKTHLLVGTVKENTKTNVVFKATKVLHIANMVSSCQCMSTKYNAKSGVLSTVFKSGHIPPHLYRIGIQTLVKYITVYYKDGTSDILSFEVQVKKS